MSELSELVNDPRNYDELDELYLCFIRLIGEENDGFYRYEFIFTDDINSVWSEDFAQKPACLVNDLMVDEQYITEVHIVRMKIKLDLIQNSCCFSGLSCYSNSTAGKCLTENRTWIFRPAARKALTPLLSHVTISISGHTKKTVKRRYDNGRDQTFQGTQVQHRKSRRDRRACVSSV